MNKTTVGAPIVGIIFLVLFLVIVGPVFTIWSLNTLFNTEIPLNIWTWLSMAWMQTLLVWYISK